MICVALHLCIDIIVNLMWSIPQSNNMAEDGGCEQNDLEEGLGLSKGFLWLGVQGGVGTHKLRSILGYNGVEVAMEGATARPH